MLIFKRIITASISFLVLFFVFYFGTMIIGGGIAGVIAGANSSEEIKITAEQAGEQFALKHFGVITIASLVLSATASGILAFGGIFPWCRRGAHNVLKPNSVNPREES